LLSLWLGFLNSLINTWSEDALTHILGIILFTDNAVEAKGAPLRNASGITFAVVGRSGIYWFKIVGNIPVWPKASHGVGISSLAIARINHIVSLLLQIVSESVLSLIIPLLYAHNFLGQRLGRLVQGRAELFVWISTSAADCSLGCVLEIVANARFFLNGLLHPL